MRGTYHKLMGCPAANDVPAGGVAELVTYVPPALSESRTIVVAVVDPELVSTTLYVSISPGAATDALTYTRTDRLVLVGTT